MVEGFVNKVKWIKRSSYGQAGFPLLQRRVLLHPAQKGASYSNKLERRLEDGKTKGKRMIREGTIYEGHTLQITWSAEPPPLPRARSHRPVA